MMPRLALILLAAALPWSAARADWPPSWKCLRHWCEGPNCWKCPPKWCPCPDNYCKKPLPGTACVPTGHCNDYCKKPQPVICPVATGCCDDYCRKTLPPCPMIGSGYSYTCGACEGCAR